MGFVTEQGFRSQALCVCTIISNRKEICTLLHIMSHINHSDRGMYFGSYFNLLACAFVER